MKPDHSETNKGHDAMRDELFGILQRRLESPTAHFKRPHGISFGDSEPPLGHRNCVYDGLAEGGLFKKFPDLKINGNMVDQAESWGVDIVGKEDYLYLQTLGNFDVETTWSYLKTPPDQRAKGEALYGFRNAEGVRIEEQMRHGVAFSLFQNNL